MIRDPFLFTNFATLFTLDAAAGKKETTLKVQNKTPAWNQNFAVKIACCESLFAAWDASAGRKNVARYLHLKNLWAFSGVLPATLRALCSVAWKFNSPPLRHNGQSLHDSRWNFNAKCIWIGLRPSPGEEKCIWHWTALLTTLIRVKLMLIPPRIVRWSLHHASCALRL